MTNTKTPIKDIQAGELLQRLETIVKQAYHRRSRSLPNNLAENVETLKGDLLKVFPDVPIEVVDDAIILATLHDETQLSPAFFFQAVKKAWYTPKTNTHQWDGQDEDLIYWRTRRKEIEAKGGHGSPQHIEACEKVRHYEQGDTENDTISLLDTCANMLALMDDAEANGQKVAKVAIVNAIRIPLPAFNPKREYFYLVMRKQLDDSAASHFVTQAIKDVNETLIREGRHRLEKEEADASHDVAAQAMRLAVLDWLRACNTKNTSPSDILTPLADELSYYQFRRTR